MKAAAEARARADVFRTMKNPVRLGELRSRTWRLPLYTGKEADDPVWIKRAHDFWQRQMALYGYVVGDASLMADVDPDVGPVITTHATVLAIIPGDRVDDYELPRSQ